MLKDNPFMKEEDKDWSMRGQTLNPSHSPKRRQLENVERQLKALVLKRAHLTAEISNEERDSDQRTTPQAKALAKDQPKHGSQEAHGRERRSIPPTNY